jgi:hypothetical protein
MRYIDNMPLKKFMILGGIIITCAIFLSCFNVINNYFLDDTFFQLGRYLFKTPSIVEYFRDSPSGVYLRPVSFLSWAYNYTVFGPNPVPYHLIILVSHALASVLLFAFMLRISRNRFLSLLTGIIFAIHPLSSEVVARVINRDDIFCMIFYLVSIISFSLVRRKKAYYFISLASFILALLCKEMALTLPAMIIIYDLLFSGQNAFSKNDIIDKLKSYSPYFIILSLYLAAKLIAPLHGTYGYLAEGYPPFYRIFKEYGLFKGSMIYLAKAVYVPYKFLLFPINKFIFKEHAKMIKIFILLIICVPVAVSTIFNFKKFIYNRITIFGFLFIFFGAIPVCFLLGTIDYNKGGLINSRYLYFATAGFSIVIANCVNSICFKKGMLAKSVGRALIFFIIFLYVMLLTGNNSAFTAASKTAYEIPEQTKKLHPLISGERKIFYFIPSGEELYRCKGVHLYINGGLKIALSISYGFPVEAYIIDKKNLLERKLNYGEQLDREEYVIENFDPKKAGLDGYILKWDQEKGKIIDITRGVK